MMLGGMCRWVTKGASTTTTTTPFHSILPHLFTTPFPLPTTLFFFPYLPITTYPTPKTLHLALCTQGRVGGTGGRWVVGGGGAGFCGMLGHFGCCAFAPARPHTPPPHSDSVTVLLCLFFPTPFLPPCLCLLFVPCMPPCLALPCHIIPSFLPPPSAFAFCLLPHHYFFFPFLVPATIPSVSFLQPTYF